MQSRVNARHGGVFDLHVGDFAAANGQHAFRRQRHSPAFASLEDEQAEAIALVLDTVVGRILTGELGGIIEREHDSATISHPPSPNKIGNHRHFAGSAGTVFC